MSKGTNNIIIAGAGIAGLTLAYLLTGKSNDVLLIEKESREGGLARSFIYGDYTFDIGPHRFYTEMPDVMSFIQDILESDYHTIERKSAVWMFGQYMDWPLRLSTALKVPLPALLSIFVDFMRKGKNGGESLEDYIISRYGKTLYKIFFKPYTEKFLMAPCSSISKDWAVTGIERAVIDKKIQADSLSAIIKSILFSRPPIKFIYPKSGGIGVFSEKLLNSIEKRGGAIHFHSMINKIITEGHKISKIATGNHVFDCDLLVWTAPVTELLQLLGYEKINLDYLSLLLYNYRVDHRPLIDYQWCYSGSKDIPFNRVSIPSLFNPSLVPEGKSGICVEVTCKRGDNKWNNPENIEPSIRDSLLELGLIKNKGSISGFNIEKVPNVYPVYTLDYSEKLKKASDIVRTYKNIRLLGRTGTFWYNNMDHSIKAALDLHGEISKSAEDRKIDKR
jgi:protoporphyrinogen oxidase